VTTLYDDDEDWRAKDDDLDLDNIATSKADGEPGETVEGTVEGTVEEPAEDETDDKER
jgi:hypothetical protein